MALFTLARNISDVNNSQLLSQGFLPINLLSQTLDFPSTAVTDSLSGLFPVARVNLAMSNCSHLMLYL